MKVIFFNSSEKWGGGEKWHAEITASIHKENIIPIGFGNPKSLLYQKFKEIPIETIPIKISNLSFLNIFKIVQIIRLFKKIKADAIIINLPTDLKAAGIAARLANINRIIYRRGSAIPITNSFSNRFIFKYLVTDIISNSHETTRTLLANNAKIFPAEKIKVIYNGIHIEKHHEKLIQQEQKNNNEKIILGNLARLSFQKGQHLLIDLAERLIEKGFNFEILIAGDGELEAELKAQVIKKGLQKTIKFMGFMENPFAFMEKIDIFIFPSIWEGFGYSIVEAKLAKKPVVAFNISSNPEVIQNNIDGFLVPLNNMEALCDATAKLMTDPSLAKKMGESGHRDVLQKFTHKKCVDELISFLKKHDLQ